MKIKVSVKEAELLNGRSGMRTLSIKEGSRSSLYTSGRSRQLSQIGNRNRW